MSTNPFAREMEAFDKLNPLLQDMIREWGFDARDVLDQYNRYYGVTGDKDFAIRQTLEDGAKLWKQHLAKIQAEMESSSSGSSSLRTRS